MSQDAAKRADAENVARQVLRLNRLSEKHNLAWLTSALEGFADAAVAEAVKERDAWAYEFIAKIADAAYPKGYSGGHTHDEILGRVEKVAKWLEEWQEAGAQMPSKLAEARREERERHTGLNAGDRWDGANHHTYCDGCAALRARPTEPMG